MQLLNGKFVSYRQPPFDSPPIRNQVRVIIGRNINFERCWLTDFKIVVDHPGIKASDLTLAFKYFGEWHVQMDSPLILVPSHFTMYDILVLCGFFESKAQAKKNWKRTGAQVPSGYSEFVRISKKFNRLFTYNPDFYPLADTSDRCPLCGCEELSKVSYRDGNDAYCYTHKTRFNPTLWLL